MPAVEEKRMACMETLLHDFLVRVRDDHRIGPSHISVYTALISLYQRQKEHPVSFYGRELMKLSKLSSRTYHQCIQDLHKIGCIKYVPSFNPALGSLVWFVEL
jgi:hypothetical protein